MFDDLVTDLDRDRSSAFAQFGRAVLADVSSDDLEKVADADLLNWVRALFAALEAGRSVVVGNDNGPHTSIIVIAEAMAHLAESIAIGLDGQTVHRLFHTLVAVTRDSDGGIVRAERPGPHAHQPLTAVVYVEVDRIEDEAARDQVATRVRETLTLLSLVHDDRAAMRRLVEEVDSPEVRQWLTEDFILLGALAVHADAIERFGIVRAPAFADAAPPPSRDNGSAGEIRTGTTLIRSPLYRDARLDVVAVHGAAGELRFVGLFPSEMSASGVLDLPFVQEKVRRVRTRFPWPEGSDNRRAATAALERLPVDELFGASDDELYRMVTGIVELAHRPRDVRIFDRRDHYGQVHSFVVLFPRDRYNTPTRRRIVDLLSAAVNGTVAEFGVSVTEAPHAWLHVSISSAAPTLSEDQIDELEEAVSNASLRWEDALRLELERSGNDQATRATLARYDGAFPADYTAVTSVVVALEDIAHIDQLSHADLTFRPTADEHEAELRLVYRGPPMTLSDMLPVLHNLGLEVIDERPYVVRPKGLDPVNVSVIGVRTENAVTLVEPEVNIRVSDTFRRVLQGDADNDDFNRLVLAAGLNWREAAAIRAYYRYRRQVGGRYEAQFVAATFVEHPDITRLLLRMFHARFDPERSNTEAAECALVRTELEAALHAVESLDHDVILRTAGASIAATVRTNFYCTDAEGRPLPYLAFKFDPALVPGLPLPRPRHEIFVYSPRTEGVHLRAGRVARGGIRWSDRFDDYRTEVLQLMKAQVTKNAVIVPTGAKGGFVCKRLPRTADRTAINAEVVACYRLFISGLLDLTDNIAPGGVVAPSRVRRHDGDDTYLVVAADKGTASFSDIANELAMGRGFWLGDAFASGGSEGYDHKEMGITAKGAWQSVLRHFDEIGIAPADVATTIGIGDMSGDVFGNGMLETSRLALIAAFDHRHIFIDPTPDPGPSYDERRRLFELRMSSWNDYNRELISSGGGIYPRAAKSIAISPEARQALAIEDTAEELTPAALIQAIIRAPADLLFNGGIGTFVKAHDEDHRDVGDKTNDAIRVDARDLRVRVIGEGGNLGLTQLARIEYSRQGGRVFSDAVDNSAGVNTSDHEVNIKILLDAVCLDGRLDAGERRELLEGMRDEVADHVLATNHSVARALTNAMAEAHSLVQVHKEQLRWLEQVAQLDRDVEKLPSASECEQRWQAGEGLTAPELAVMMAYTKTVIATDLADADLLSDDAFVRLLADYFPLPLRERYGADIARHTLRNELIAAITANRLVDRGGTSIVYRLIIETGAAVAEIARAHQVAWQLFAMGEALEAIDDLAGVAPAVRTTLRLDSRRLVERATRWFVRHERPPIDVDASIDRLRPGVDVLAEHWDELISPALRTRIIEATGKFVDAGVPGPVAAVAARNRTFAPALEIVDAAREADQAPLAVARTYFSIDEALSIGRIVELVDALARDDEWKSLARLALRDDLFATQRQLTQLALVRGGADALFERAEAAVQRWHAVIARLPTAKASLDQLSVVVRELRRIPAALT
ncbi:MAG TPA: NAD-glutamate dehydrogenase domain-containing protein [Acidimicrobiales bacterium]|nr:NAD-glutamate dehydrogenase domain-containing protein [Acidimicrobiales bacterium]